MHLNIKIVATAIKMNANQKKPSNLPKFSINKLLNSLKRSIEINKQHSKYRTTTLLAISNLPRTAPNQPFQTEIESSRNTAVLYVNMIPPR